MFLLDPLELCQLVRFGHIMVLQKMKYYKNFLQAGFISIEPKTGYIRSWVGGINHKFFKYDHVKQGRRQPGSTF